MKTFLAKIVKSGLFSTSVYSLFVMVTGVFFSFLVQLLAARILGVESFGNYIYVLTWVLMLSVPAKLGFDMAAIRFIPVIVDNGDYRRFSGYMLIASSVVCIVSILISIIVVSSTFLFEQKLTMDGELFGSFMVFSPLLIVISFVQFQAAILRSLGRPLYALVPYTLVYPMITLLLLLLSTKFYDELTAYFALSLNLASAIVIFLSQIFIYRSIRPKKHSDESPVFETWRWIRTAAPMSLTDVSQSVARQLDVLIVGMVIGVQQAGIYAVASRISTLAGFSRRAVNVVVGPYLSHSFESHGTERLQTIASDAVLLSSVISLPFIILIIIFSQNILLLFGSEFLAGSLVLYILLCAEAVNVIMGSNGIIMNMSGMQDAVAKNVFHSLIWLILAVPSFSFLWGSEGAALAVTLIVFIRNISLSYHLWRKAGINSTLLPFHKLPDRAA